MNIALWVVAGVLAASFLVTGGLKIALGAKVRDKGMAWATGWNDAQVRALGVAEVLGALGLVLPAATGIAPVLVPVAASGLVLVMVGAAIRHIQLKEPIIPNVVLGLLAAFVAVGRFFLEPFAG